MKTHFPIVIILFAAASGCDSQNHHDILESIDRGVVALENEDVRGAIKCTTADFLGFPGKFNRQALAWRLKQQFDTSGGMAIHAPTPNIEIDGDTAVADGPFIITRPDIRLPELSDARNDLERWVEMAASLAEVHRAELILVKVDEAWRVQTIRVF